MNKKEFLEFLKKLEQLKKQNQEQEKAQENEIEPETPPISDNSPAEENQNYSISNTPKASESGLETPLEKQKEDLPNYFSTNEPSIEDLGEQQDTVVPTPFVPTPENLRPKYPKKK